MPFPHLERTHPLAAFVYLEVLISMFLICMAMGSIASTYVRASKILRSSLQVAAASQILQQRVEMLRDQPWASIANAPSLARMMQTATESEREIPSGVVETIEIIVPKAGGKGLAESDRWFSVRRDHGAVSVETPDDFSSFPTLLVEGSVAWVNSTGPHERRLRVVISQNGLTRSGIISSAFGRSDTRVSNPTK